MEFRKIVGVDTIEMYYGQLSMKRDNMSYLALIELYRAI
jgi:hypothetical protein